MVTKDKKKGTTRLAVKPAGEARSVQLAGDFQSWKPAPMRKTKDGSFEAKMPLPAGTYQYKFIIDGQWSADPDNSVAVPNEHGTLNSVAVVQ